MCLLALRHASLTDLEAIMLLDQVSNPHPWGMPLIKEALLSRYNWVVEKTSAGNTEQGASSVVGWLSATFLLDQSELELIVVDQQQRRKGVAKQLLAAWMHDMSTKGAIEYLLEVRESNEGAIQLYQSLGFEGVGRRKNYYATADGSEAACLFTLKV